MRNSISLLLVGFYQECCEENLCVDELSEFFLQICHVIVDLTRIINNEAFLGDGSRIMG